MIRLNLTATPEWLDLAPGLRLLVGPHTTALMVSARADLAVETLPEGATQEEMALAMAKSVARRAVLDWEGVGDDAGKITVLLASGPARKALGLLLIALTIALFLMNLRRAGERTGRLAERLSTSERTHEVQRQMLEGASRRPADRDALAQRMRDGRF